MKVVLIGDSIRIGYQPFVAKKLPKAAVWEPAENGRSSFWALSFFHEWVVEQKPDILHVNFGIHAAKHSRSGNTYVSVANL